MSIDERIESAGSRLASIPVAVPELERLVRRRSRRVRANAVVGSVVVMAIGVAALVNHESSPARQLESGVPTDNRAGDSSATRYELALAGARPVDDSTRPARGGPSAVWFDEATETYLTLFQGKSIEPTGVEPMVEDTTFPATQGRAWFTNTHADAIRQMTMWWSRPAGEVWILEAFWYGDAPMNTADGRRTLRTWALGITQHHELADSSMRRIAEDQGGDVDTRTQVWDYQAGSAVEQIIVGSDDGSVAAGVIAVLARDKPEHVRVDGHDAWQVTDPTTGETRIGWQTGGNHPTWVGLIIPARLASLTPQIRAALRSVRAPAVATTEPVSSASLGYLSVPTMDGGSFVVDGHTLPFGLAVHDPATALPQSPTNDVSVIYVGREQFGPLEDLIAGDEIYWMPTAARVETRFIVTGVQSLDINVDPATTATSGLVVVIDTALPNTGQRIVVTAVKEANTTTTDVTTT